MLGHLDAAELARDLVDVDGTLFYTASDGVHGRELWTSDGTEAGTVRITDIADDADGYFDSLHDLTPVGDTLFFTADDGVHGRELWKSDGTAAGTVLVKDINRRRGDYPSYLTPAGNALFFTIDDGVHGEELWRSDGTRAGTVLVKDILPGKDGGMSSPRMSAVGGTVYFNAYDGVHGTELWKSDGTKAGTVLVKDVRAGKKSGLAYTEWPTTVGQTVYFTANDGVRGKELWKSDGTRTGTVLVANVNPGARDANPDYLTGVDGRVFFWADDRDHGSALWTSDGTKAGTVLVRDPVPGDADVYVGPRALVSAAGSTVFFTSYDDVHGRELWKSDGTEAGTVLVKDINPGLYSSNDLYSSGESQTPTAVGDTLFFTARDGVHGQELWKSDGTDAGTALVKDIYQDTPDNGPTWLAGADGRLFFAADDGVHGYELWASDGTAAGTAMLKDIDSGGRFSVASKATPDTQPGTFLLQAYADKAGQFEVAPVGGSPIKSQVLDSPQGRFNIMLTLTRAGRKELEKNGMVRVRVRFTFTACDGAVSSAVQRFTLEEAPA